MDISFRQLEHILALARHRHYGQAAEALGISQPALSRSVIALEQQVGVKLFERSRAGVQLTDAGRLLLRHAREVRAQTAAFEAELREAEGQARQQLSVVCGHFPAELTVPGALSALMREQPRAQVSLEVADWSRGIQLMERSACDLAIIELSASQENASWLQELLNDRAVYAVVRRGHPLARRRHPDLEELLAYPWASSRIPWRAARHMGPGPVAAGDFDDQTRTFVPKIAAPSLTTSLKLACETDIVCIAPLTVAAPFLEDGRLQLVRFEADWLRLNYGFVWDPSTPRGAVMRAFMDRVREAEARQREHNADLRRRYGFGA